jgi:hypothetical protein
MKETIHIAIIAAIIILAGLLGGYVNYLLSPTTNSSPNRFEIRKSLFLGLVASATVPLFLNTVSSELLQNADLTHYVNFFIFGGFCLIAAVYSARFLQSLGENVLRQLEEVKKEQQENKEKVDAIVKQTSDDSAAAEEAPEEQGGEVVVEDETRHRGVKLVPQGGMQEATPTISLDVALRSSRFAFRTVAGLKKDTGLDATAIRSRLADMEGSGLVQKFKRGDGETVWSLTAKGRAK